MNEVVKQTAQPIFPRESPYWSSKVLIHAARKDALTLRDAVEPWLKSALRYAHQTCKETGDTLHLIRVELPMPEDFDILVANSVNNLRSSLDHAVASSARLIDPKIDDTKLKFPISLKDVENGSFQEEKNLKKRLPVSLVDVMISWKPWPSGDNLIVGVAQLSNTNKHRLIPPILSHVRPNLKKIFEENDGGTKFFSPYFDLDAGGYVFGKSTAGSNMRSRYYFEADVVFGDVGLLSGRHISGTLQDIADHFIDVCRSLVAETYRLTGRG